MFYSFIYQVFFLISELNALVPMSTSLLNSVFAPKFAPNLGMFPAMLPIKLALV